MKAYIFLIWASIKECWVRDGVCNVGLKKILSKTSRRFISHLDSILENGNWKLKWKEILKFPKQTEYLPYLKDRMSTKA